MSLFLTILRSIRWDSRLELFVACEVVVQRFEVKVFPVKVLQTDVLDT